MGHHVVSLIFRCLRDTAYVRAMLSICARCGLDIGRYASNLTQIDEAIWMAGTVDQVSYPTEGNASCFELEDRSFWFSHRSRCIVEVLRRFPPDGVIFD